MKKTRVGGKTEIGNLGKNAKVGSSFPTGGRLLSVATSKPSAAPSYKTAKPHKSSTSFGVIWIPRRKINKYHKDKVYNPNKNDRSYDRSPSMYNMSGDSSNHETLLKNKDDESVLLAPENSGYRTVTEQPVPGGVSPRDKQDLSNQEKEDDQEAAGDTEKNSIDSEPRTEKDRESEVKSEKEKLEDNVDSVFLRSAPAHKRAASASPPQEEDCGIKCLYYTLQCCDCTLM